MKTMVFFLLAYVGMMTVAAGIFSWLWGRWEGAPDIFYRPWQMFVVLAAVFSVSFLLGFPSEKADGYRMLRRYVAGAAVRGAGLLAVVAVPVLLFPQREWDRVAMVLCVMGIYLLSVFFYLYEAYRAQCRWGKKNRPSPF